MWEQARKGLKKNTLFINNNFFSSGTGCQGKGRAVERVWSRRLELRS